MGKNRAVSESPAPTPTETDGEQVSLDLSPLANCRRQSTIARPMMGQGRPCGLYLVTSDPGAVPVPLPKRVKGENGQPGESAEAFGERLAGLVSRMDERAQSRYTVALAAGMLASEAFVEAQGWPAQVVGTADLVARFRKDVGRNGLVQITRLPPEIAG
jgi:hypothetical protein